MCRKVVDTRRRGSTGNIASILKYVAQKVKAFEQAWKGFNLQETKQ
jgi:hypothetical protein